MAQVIIKGIYMGASLKQGKNQDGTPGKMSCMVDIYQPDSPDKDKMVSVKADDPAMKEYFEDNYQPMQQKVYLMASVNAYRNDAYYKFVEDVTEALSTPLAVAQ
jgi:hypothetical protein